jgi:hypothetical protein
MWPYTAEELDYLANFVPSPAVPGTAAAHPSIATERVADDSDGSAGNHRRGRRPTSRGGA